LVIKNILTKRLADLRLFLKKVLRFYTKRLADLRLFLKKVLRFYKDKKVYMVLDNVRYHHAKKLKYFLKANENKLEIIFLPAYSPDLNPMERIWWYMRKKITHHRYTETLKCRVSKFWKLFSTFKKENQRCRDLCNLCVIKF